MKGVGGVGGDGCPPPRIDLPHPPLHARLLTRNPVPSHRPFTHPRFTPPPVARPWQDKYRHVASLISDALVCDMHMPHATCTCTCWSEHSTCMCMCTSPRSFPALWSETIRRNPCTPTPVPGRLTCHPPRLRSSQGECLRSTRRAEFEAFTATTIGLPNDAFEPRAAANSSGGSDAQIVTPAFDDWRDCSGAIASNVSWSDPVRMHMQSAHAVCTCLIHAHAHAAFERLVEQPDAHAACTCTCPRAHAPCTRPMHMHMHISHVTCPMPHAHAPCTCTCPLAGGGRLGAAPLRRVRSLPGRQAAAVRRARRRAGRRRRRGR